MNKKYITECADSKKYYLLFPIGKTEKNGDKIINDLLSSISFTIKHFKNLHSDSPNFIKALRKIEKKLWKMI